MEGTVLSFTSEHALCMLPLMTARMPAPMPTKGTTEGLGGGGEGGGAAARRVFFFKQKTAYEIGLGIPAEPLFRSLYRLSDTWNNFWKDGKADGIGSNLS